MGRHPLRVSEFEWDDGNVLHLQLGHGIEPEEAEEAFAVAPLLRRTRLGHYAVFGPTRSSRYLIIIFERKQGDVARPITGWDMTDAERRYYRNSLGRGR